MGLNHSCRRDLLGYGPEPPDPKWPNQAKVAVQFVLNYEEGGENCVLYGDPYSESYLWEIVGAPGLAGVRNMNIESIYEYGSRSGVWRILALFREHRLPLTVYAVGMALRGIQRLQQECSLMVMKSPLMVTDGSTTSM